MVVASGGNLYPLMFEEILRDVHGISRDWQIVFTLEGMREVVDIRVETERTDLDALRQEIFDRIANCYPDLMKNFALGTFEMTVSRHAPGELRTGRKLRRMVDRRFDTGDKQPAIPASPTGKVAGTRN